VNTDLWSQILEMLEQQMTKAMFYTLLDGSHGVVDGDVLHVQLKTQSAVERTEGLLTPMIKRTVARVVGRALAVEVGVDALPVPLEAPHELPPANRVPPVYSDEEAQAEREGSVDLARLNPDQYGYVKLSHYAVRFWLPVLGVQPFVLWLALRSYAFASHGSIWPSIQTLADISARGNRHVLLGRAEWKGGKAVAGALQVLESEHVVTVLRRGWSIHFRC
jgi:hypothetical protein